VRYVSPNQDVLIWSRTCSI